MCAGAPSPSEKITDYFPMAYDITYLLNYSSSPFLKNEITKEQVICDIDKTYLETQTSSFMDLAKAAFEKPKDKKTVLGATHYLEALLWSEERRYGEGRALSCFPKNLHFVSASPPQLRNTLEEKFLMDRLCWSSLTLKNQLYNIKKIKFHLLREQFSFKTLAIFNLFHKNPGSHFFLIGDNAESDPYIYAGIKLFKDGQLSHKAYMEFLRMAGLTRESIRTVAQSKGFLKPAKIKSIFIRDLGAGPKPLIDSYITKFSSYKNLLLKSYRKGYLCEKIFLTVLARLYGRFSSKEHSMAQSLYQDLLKSGCTEEEAADFTLCVIEGKAPKVSALEPPSSGERHLEEAFLQQAKTWFNGPQHHA